MIKADQVIDVKGQKCPRPLLITKQTLKAMQAGKVLQVISDDVTTKLTFQSYLQHSGDELLDMHEDGLDIHHYIKKK
jgi:TusA-related sulfurtransferase